MQPQTPRHGVLLTALLSLLTVAMTTVEARAQTWSAIGTGMNQYANCLTLRPNGEIVAGGGFTTAGGTSANRIATWNGTAWSPLGTGANLEVDALTTMPNGDIVAGGRFTNMGGTPANRIARWNGATWSSLGAGVGIGPSYGVLALTTLPNGDLVAAGDFPTAGGASALRIARWNGTAWSTLGSGTNNRVLCLATMPNGDIVAGGLFTTAGGTAANHIARWNGTTWSALATGTNNNVDCLKVLPNGDLVAGGEFTSAGGVPAHRIARWNGVSWSALGSGIGNPFVAAIAVMSNGDLVASGSFGSPGSSIARWNGASWAPIGSGANGEVLALLTLPNGDLVLGGTFTNAGGTAANRIARYGAPTATLQANFTATPTLGFAPLSVQFTDTSTASGSAIVNWAWDFDADTVTDSTLQNPAWVYTQSGTYTVQLTVTNALGTPSTFTRQNYITVVPVAGAGAAARDIVFNELVYDDAGSGNEFLELFRRSGSTNLAGYYVLAVTASTQTIVAVAPPATSINSHFVFGTGGTPLLAALPNDAASLRLHDASGALQDTLAYEAMAGALPSQLLQGHALFGEHVYDPAHPTSWSRGTDGHVTSLELSPDSDNGLEWRILSTTRGTSNDQPELKSALGFEYEGGITTAPAWDGNLGAPSIGSSPTSPGGGNHAVFEAPPTGGSSYFYQTTASDNFQLDGWFRLELPPVQPGGLCVWSVGLCGTTDTNYLPPDPWRERGVDQNGDTGVTWTYEVTNSGAGPVGRLSLVDNEAGGTDHLVLWSTSITNADWYRLGLGVAPGSLSVRFGGTVGNGGAVEFDRPHYSAFGGVYVGIRQSANVGFGLRVDSTILNGSWNSGDTTGPGCDGNCPPRNSNPGVLDRSVTPAVQTFAILITDPGVPYSAEQLCFYMAARSKTHATMPQVSICPATTGSTGALEPGAAVGTFPLHADGLEWWVADLPNLPSGERYLLPIDDVFYVLDLPASIQPPIVSKLADGSLPEMVPYQIPGPNGTWLTQVPAAFALKWKCAGSSAGLIADVDSDPTIDTPMLDFRLTTDIAAPQIAFLAVGYTTLQLPLTPFGAPTCWLFNDLGAVVAAVTVGSAASVPVTVPIGLPLGLAIHSQWAVLDPSYNALGLRTTNRHSLTVR